MGLTYLRFWAWDREYHYDNLVADRPPPGRTIDLIEKYAHDLPRLEDLETSGSNYHYRNLLCFELGDIRPSLPFLKKLTLRNMYLRRPAMHWLMRLPIELDIRQLESRDEGHSIRNLNEQWSSLPGYTTRPDCLIMLVSKITGSWVYLINHDNADLEEETFIDNWGLSRSTRMINANLVDKIEGTMLFSR